MFKRSTVPLGVLSLMGAYLVIGWLAGFLQGLFPQTYGPYLQIQYFRDGSAGYEEHDWASREYNVYDSQGNVIKRAKSRKEASVGQVAMLYFALPDPSGSYRRRPASGVMSIGPQRGEFWYILPAEGLMEGFSRATRRLIGYMTPEGFVSEEPGPQSRFSDIKRWLDSRSGGQSRFEWDYARSGESADARVWLLNGRDLFVIDTEAHTVRKLATLPEHAQLLGIYNDWVIREADAGPVSQGQFIFAVAGKRLLKLTMQGEILGDFPLPEEIVGESRDKGATYRSLGLVDNGGTILTAYSYHKKPGLYHVVILNGKGDPVRSYSLPGSPSWRKEPQQSAVRGWMRIAGWKTTEGPWLWMPMIISDSYTGRSVGLWLYVSLLYAVLCACIIGFDARGRRVSWPTRIFWIVFGFLFSLPGLAVYFVVGPRAPMTACPSCGGKRPIDVVECPRCKAAFPKPAPTGLEIFDKT